MTGGAPRAVPPAIAYGLGALAGLGAGFGVFRPTITDPDALFWRRLPGDLAQSFIGFSYYVKGAVGPFLVARDMGVDGTPVLFSDSFPLGPILARALDGVLHLPIAWYGVGWILLTATLQVLSVLCLARGAGLRDALSNILIVALALNMSVWLSRFYHLGLFGQWPIPLALAAHARVMAAEAAPDARWRAVALGIGAAAAPAWMHLYVLAMTVPLFLGMALQWGWSRRLSWMGVGAAVAGLAATTIGLLAAARFFEGGSLPPAPDAPWGQHALALVAPFVSLSSALLNDAQRLLGWPPAFATFMTRYGLSGPDPNDTMVYLGAGAIGILAILALGAPRALAAAIKRHALVALALAGLAAFAISPDVWIVDAPVLSLPRPETGPIAYVAAQLRYSARMIWPVLYVATLCGFILAWKLERGAAWRLVIVGLIALQVYDTRPLVAYVDRMARQTGARATTMAEPDRWARFIAGHDRVRIWPKMLCNPHFNADSYQQYLDWHLAASRSARPINSIYRQRARTECLEDLTLMRAPPADDGTLSLYVPYGIDDPALIAQRAADPLCRSLDGVLACTGRWALWDEGG